MDERSIDRVGSELYLNFKKQKIKRKKKKVKKVDQELYVSLVICKNVPIEAR